VFAARRHGGDAPAAPALGAEGHEVEVAAGARDRPLFVEARALLAQEVHGDAVVDGDHVVDPGQGVQVVGVADVVDGQVRVAVNGVIVPLDVDGEGKGPGALSAVGGKALVAVRDLAGLDQLDQAGVEHLRVDAEIPEAGVGHCADTGRGQGADAELDDIPVPHDRHDVVGDGLFLGLGLDGPLVDLGPPVPFHVHLDPVVDLVDVDRIEAAALGPGVVGSHLDDGLLGALGEDAGIVRAVGKIRESVRIPGGRRVPPPVEAPLLLHGVDEAVMAKPHPHGPSPLRPAGHLVCVAGLAAPGEEEILVEAVVFLLGVHLLEFEMGIEHGVVPDLDVFHLAGAGAEAPCQLLHALRGVTPDGSGLDPVPRLDHVHDLLGCPFLIADFLLHRRRHSAPSLRMMDLSTTCKFRWLCSGAPAG